MNLSESAVVLRPRTVAEVFDLSLKVTFRLALAIYARIAAFTLLPVFVLLTALYYFAKVDALTIWTLALVFAIWLDAPFTIAASRLMFRDEPKTKETLSRFARRLWSYTGALLYKSFLLGLAALPLLIPLLAIGPRAIFVTEASVLEQASATEAYNRSKRLVQARSGDALGAFLAWLVARAAFVVGIEALCQGIVVDVFQLPTPFGRLSDTGFTPYALAGLLLSTPFVATARFLQYVDTRTRTDGWDIQVRFMAILAREAEKKSEARA